MATTQGYAEVNGTRLYYEVEGDGPAVVLLHGFSLDHRMWDAQVPALTPHYRVIRYDLRGFGRSALPDGPYAHADDLAALLTILGVERAAVVGLSLGGMYATEFALAYPERTRALVLIDAVLSGFATSEETNALNRPIWARDPAVGVAERKARWLAHPFFAPAQEQPDVAAALAAIVGDYSGWHWFNRNPDSIADPPAARQLGRIAAPALVIVGERDLPDFRAMADQLTTGIPGARKVVVPRVGHMANMEAPDEVNAALLAFLTDTEAPYSQDR